MTPSSHVVLRKQGRRMVYYVRTRLGFNFKPNNPGHACVFSRREAPELCRNYSPKTEGVGNAGCPLHPQPRV